MNRTNAIARLKQLEPTLKAQGVEALYLFGSISRGDAGASSDVDVAFDVAPAACFSVLDQARIQVDLEDALGTEVDFVERDALRPRILQRIQADLVRVF